MNKKLYVGGLPYSVTDDQLKTLFESHGTVESAMLSWTDIPTALEVSVLLRWVLIKKQSKPSKR